MQLQFPHINVIIMRQLIYLLVILLVIQSIVSLRVNLIDLIPQLQLSSMKSFTKRFASSSLNGQPMDNQLIVESQMMGTPVITYYPLELNQINHQPQSIFIPITGMVYKPQTIGSTIRKWSKYYVPKGFARNYVLYKPYRSTINLKLDTDAIKAKERKIFGQPTINSCNHDYFDREKVAEEIESGENYPFFMVNAWIADWVTRFYKFEYDYASNSKPGTRSMKKVLRTVLNAI